MEKEINKTGIGYLINLIRNAIEALSGRVSTIEDAPIEKIEPEVTQVVINPNKFYLFGEVASLSITLGEAIDGRYNEYMFQFTSGSTATVLSMPSELKWQDDNELIPSENTVYQVSIVNNLAVYAEWEVTA